QPVAVPRQDLQRDDRPAAAAEDVGSLDPVVVQHGHHVGRLVGDRDGDASVVEPAAGVAPAVVGDHREPRRQQRYDLGVHLGVTATAGDQHQRRAGTGRLRVQPRTGGPDGVYAIDHVYSVD